MSKLRVSLIIGLSLFILSVAFTNCSKANFAAMPDADLKSVSNGDGSSPISEDEADQITNNLPPEERDTYRPVTDLENDPNLYDLYACGDGGVLICHFPSGWDSQHYQCIGRPAVDTHFSHGLILDHNGQSVDVHDYLGKCRFTIDQIADQQAAAAAASASGG